ncbi:MAG: tail fiber protein [Blastocatellia bacterium]|nr:tail fiber protein [Blastocatellia bacterium]
MATPFIGEIKMFGGNFAPLGYAFCDGALLAISQNDTLFIILGTTFGGDGQTTFGLPDFRGRVPIHAGQGPGLSAYPLGQKAGAETVTLAAGQIPAHTHSFSASTADATSNTPTTNVPAAGGSYATTPGTTMNAAMVGTAGGGQAHENRMPFLTVTFVIALQGIFPTRN